MSGRVKRRVGGGPAALLGLDVEARVAGGTVVRGRLLSAGADWLEIEKATGRAALVRTSAVTTLVDERAPLLTSAGSRDADAALGDGE